MSTIGRMRRCLAWFAVVCLLGVAWTPAANGAASPALAVTGEWRLSGSITLSGCQDARLNGTRPAAMIAAAIKVRDRFAANAGLAQGGDRFALDIIGTVANGMLSGTFTGVRRGPGSLRGSVTGSVAGNALTLSLSAEISGQGCTFSATLGGTIAPADEDTFRIGIDVGQHLPQVRFRAGSRALALNNLLPSGQTVGEELSDAFDRLFGRTGSRLSQNPATGVTGATLPGRRFAFLQSELTTRPTTGAPTRQQVTPALATDATTGTVTVTTASGTQVSLVPAPLDLEAFLDLVAPLGVAGADVTGSQFLFTTTGPLQFSVRFDLEVGSGGTTAGVLGQSNGTAVSTYATGETQRLNPLVVDQTLFAQAALETPGVTSVAQDFEGVISLVSGGSTTRLRPDFVVGASPAGARRALALESTGAFSFDTGEGRRQRFFVIP